MQERTSANHRTSTLTLAALGVVYGDIGTSPLYAMRECFQGDVHVALNTANVMGILSLVFWSLILVISLKYLGFVMRADNDGEGGILALMKLAVPRTDDGHGAGVLILLGLFGAGLLYGDGIITPAISVLSAVEGIHIVAPSLDKLVIPITLGILFALFKVQRRGTGSIGRLFGPVMIVWFGVLALLGVVAISREPQVLAAVSPHFAWQFFVANRMQGWLVLGVVFLVVTGGEALYADMGHFGALPIRLAWYLIVLPALLLNYFGQGALLIADPAAIKNPFYLMAPGWALLPLVMLSTFATVIASQAVISGAFSLSSQAVQMGYCPRLKIIHTSKEERGQIYVPAVNWLLFVAVVGLVLAFRTSTSLAGAYGMAVTTTMVITSVLFYVVARRQWDWSRWTAGTVAGFFLLFDVAFFTANLSKLLEGGWFPLLVGGGICLAMTTWYRGKQLTLMRLTDKLHSIDDFVAELVAANPNRVPMPAVYLSANSEKLPRGLTHNWKHNRVLHTPVVLLTIVIEDRPWVALGERLQVVPLGHELFQVSAHYGFMQRPNIPNIVNHCRQYDFDATGPDTTYFLGRVTIDVGDSKAMPHWRKQLFIAQAKIADDVTHYFGIPPEQVVEIGTRVEL